jgi:hypothetical protein
MEVVEVDTLERPLPEGRARLEDGAILVPMVPFSVTAVRVEF